MDDTTLFRLMQRQNINCLSMFYKHVSMAIQDVANQIDNWEELDKPNKTWWKAEFAIHYPQKMLDTTFLLMFGHLEEMLVLLHKKFNPKKVGINDREKSIKKFKPYINSLLGNNLEHYNFLLEAYSIRNSLIHCAGRISMMKDKERIKKILERNADYFGRKNDRVVIKLEGLSKIQKAINQLTEELLNEAIQPTQRSMAATRL